MGSEMCIRDRVEVDRVAVAVVRAGWRAPLQQLLVVGSIMLLVEARAETKVGQLDVSAAVQENVVRFDVAVDELVLFSSALL